MICRLAASVTLNPTDLALLTGIGIAWTAYGSPRTSLTRSVGQSPGRRRISAATAAAALAVGLAFAATVAANVVYWEARVAIQHSAIEDAEADLSVAISLDPSMALYHRQLATLQLIDGRPREAVVGLLRASALNPSDDLAWRTLGLAAAALNDGPASRNALEHAVSMQRSDPTNLLLLAQAFRIAGNEASARKIPEWSKLGRSSLHPPAGTASSNPRAQARSLNSH